MNPCIQPNDRTFTPMAPGAALPPPMAGIPVPAGMKARPPADALDWAPEDAPRRFDPETVFLAGLREHNIANTAYPIAHRKTIWDFRQPGKDHPRLLRKSFGAGAEMCLYAHIPFCERRCGFCEYTVVTGHDAELEKTYFRGLFGELDYYMNLLDSGEKELAGFDIGGGTPALADPGLISDLVDRVAGGFRLAPGFGISIETTPKIAATMPERMRALRRAGIERISMGLQTINPRLLRTYGRDTNRVGHNPRAVEHIRAAGFKRFNIDLMYGFARQQPEDFRATLEYTIRLAPEYITLYRMRYKGTRVAGEARDVRLSQVMDMYEQAGQVLAAAGYHAEPGKNGFSRVSDDPGTSEYLTERVVRSTPYLGLGLGAQTFTNNILAYNLGAASKRIKAYLKAAAAGRPPIQDLYHLPKSEGMAKMVSVSFYFGQIHLGAFRQRFGKSLFQQFPAETAFVLDRGLMVRQGNLLKLTHKGAGAINGVIALFYSDRVKDHLIHLEGKP